VKIEEILETAARAEIDLISLFSDLVEEI